MDTKKFLDFFRRKCYEVENTKDAYFQLRNRFLRMAVSIESGSTFFFDTVATAAEQMTTAWRRYQEAYRTTKQYAHQLDLAAIESETSFVRIFDDICGELEVALLTTENVEKGMSATEILQSVREHIYKDGEDTVSIPLSMGRVLRITDTSHKGKRLTFEMCDENGTSAWNISACDYNAPDDVILTHIKHMEGFIIPTTYICKLPKEMKGRLGDVLRNKSGLSNEDIKLAFDGRLCDLNDTLTSAELTYVIQGVDPGFWLGDTVYEVCRCDDEAYRVFPMKVGTIAPYGDMYGDKEWHFYLYNDTLRSKAYKSVEDLGKTLFVNEQDALKAVDRFITEEKDEGLEV